MKAKSISVQNIDADLGGNCIVCGKPVDAFYGRWGNAGTCAKKCEDVQEKRATVAFINLQAALAEKERVT